MKHTETISSSSSEILKGKKILLVVTGSIAAIESPKIARELMRHGAKVFCVMSGSAQHIIHPWALQCITGKETITEITGACEHIEYCSGDSVDLVLISPATANTISKIASGIFDDAVSTMVSTALGAGIPIILAPAMHDSIAQNPFYLENLKRLQAVGVSVVQPKKEEGKSKLDWRRVSEAVLKHFEK
jgi:phosphopantothenoylcysteine decarboxylase / phosphopantothenate---cysteine ligase